MFIFCGSAVRSFAPIARPFSWMLARFVGAMDAFGASAAWQSVRTRAIDPLVHAVRTYAIDPVVGSAIRGLSIVASQLPASISTALHVGAARWRRVTMILGIGILVLMSPLRRFVLASAVKSCSSLPQQ